MIPNEGAADQFDLNDAASLGAIEALEVRLQIRLPDSYREFFQRHNGGEGFVGENYLALWPVESLIDHNMGYGTLEFLPWFFLIGSDGGGEGYGFDLRKRDPPVLAIPFESLDERYAVLVADSFDSLFETFRTTSGILPERSNDE